jgi:hypothetical protein
MNHDNVVKNITMIINIREMLPNTVLSSSNNNINNNEPWSFNRLLDRKQFLVVCGRLMLGTFSSYPHRGIRLTCVSDIVSYCPQILLDDSVISC